MDPLQSSLASLVARLRGCDPDTREVRIVTHALLGQIILFRSARTMALRRMGQEAFGPADIQEISTLVTALTNAALNFQSPTCPTGEPR